MIKNIGVDQIEVDRIARSLTGETALPERF